LLGDRINHIFNEFYNLFRIHWKYDLYFQWIL
jgi:hypothetical protein